MSTAPVWEKIARGISLVILGLLLVYLVGDFPGCDGYRRRSRGTAKAFAGNLRGVYTMLNVWAEEHGGVFPNEPGSANDNFRLLYKMKLFDDEKPFFMPGDGWCRAEGPDNDIGTAPDYSKALEPGELSVAYVAGRKVSDPPDWPVLIAGAGPGTGWITGVDKVPGKVFQGDVVVVFMGGTTKVMKPDKDGKIRAEIGGRRIDIFSTENGTSPADVRLPLLR